MPPVDERRPPLTPQLALRVAIVGSIALGLFAIVFFRLWFLQVLSGDSYAAQATTNRVRTIAVAAPRGQVVDRNGNLLVDSKPAIAVELSPPDLPKTPEARAVLYARLQRVLGISGHPTRCPVQTAYVGRLHGKPATLYHDVVQQLPAIPCLVAQQQATLPYGNVRLKTDVPKDVLFYLEERQSLFPGVQIQQVWLRRYPLHQIAAQLFGTVGPVTVKELKTYTKFKGISQSSIVGQSGLEYFYDSYLRGADGKQQVQVNSLGQFKGYLPGSAPAPGHTLKLSLDVSLQKVGQAALARTVAGNPPATGGAFVAMNPQDGQIYAMGSNPTFDPNIFTKPVSKAAYDQLNNASSQFPLINRAIQSAGPDGSTFKPITATAALSSGDWQTGETYNDTGKFCEDNGLLCRRNAGGAVNGVIDMVKAIQVSSDVFFYRLGQLMNVDTPQGGPLQQWARNFGIGQPTGIDLGGEVTGNLPSPTWRERINQVELRCEHRRHPGMTAAQQFSSAVSCGIADGRPWSEGDNVNLAVGQGDVQVSPLQLAVAYSTLANGGTVVRPHLGLEVDNQNGSLAQTISPAPTRRLKIDPAYLSTVLAGMHAAAQSPGGTSYDVMGSFPQTVYGKTGTAQYNGQQDYSWYACFVPGSATSKPIVVVVWVEQGGFGDTAAAPVARQILSQWFTGHPGKFIVGSSKTL